MNAPLRPGLYLAHKPPGMTSFERVQAFLRDLPGGKADLPVSHAGALDPFAEGLLLLLAGSATRLMDALHVAPKHYLATVAWDAETDTGDAGGKVVSTDDAAALTPSRLDEVLKGFIGWHDQVPPATSNKRVDGERAYVKAHRGEEVVLPPSRVYLHEARWVSHSLPASSTLELICGGGYYVRSLARELGRTLGVGAHLTALHRTQIGPWRDPGSSTGDVVTGRALLPWLPSREVTDFEAGAIRQGGEVRLGRVVPPEWPLPSGFHEGPLPVRAFQKERLIALLEAQGDRLRPGLWLRGL